jgi:nifR3 family TIM-barrel protein
VLAAVVRAAGSVPVTVKVRIGLDDEHITWPQAVDIAADEGAAWFGMHARTSKALYSGKAQWDEIARLKERARLPILGNGDIWEAFDALRMMRHTGCDGVIIGRGCLGRPWLFRELAEVFAGAEPSDPPNLGEVLLILREHAGLLVEFFGERKGVLEMRKWCAWYTKGFDGAASVRKGLQRINSLDEMDRWLEELDPDVPFPREALRLGRGKRGGSQPRVSLPEGWLAQAAAEGCGSGPEVDVA